MNISIKHIANKLIGDEQRFSLSHRILNTTAVLGIILTLITSISNYILCLPQAAIIFSSISLFYFLGIYINSIKYIRYRLTYNLTSLYLVFFFIPAFWMLNSGSLGGFHYFIFFFLIVIITTTHNKEKWVYLISLVLITIFLIKIEYTYPEYVIQYSSKEDRQIDIIISIVIAMISTSLAVGIFMEAYQTANKNLTHQKKEIETQTEKLELVNEKLNELNKSKDTILSTISHDVRGPIGNMKSFIDLIIDNKSDYNHAEIMNFISTLGKQSTSVYYTLNNLMLWANNQHNNITFNPKYQSIEPAVKSNIDLLESTANNKNITIRNKIDANISVFFDLILISTVIRNLISNAIKFTPKNGEITIDIEETETNMIISVKDTGIGIPLERIDRIFNESCYETTFGTNAEKGSGLGLKICLEFVKKHKGEIWVKSEVNQGSIFRFSLPKNK